MSHLRAGPPFVHVDDLFLASKRCAVADFTVVFLSDPEFNFPRSLLALLAKAKIRIGYSGEHSFPFVNCEVR